MGNKVEKRRREKNEENGVGPLPKSSRHHTHTHKKNLKTVNRAQLKDKRLVFKREKQSGDINVIK